MKRTPQPTMAQSRLTGSGGTLCLQPLAVNPAAGAQPATASLSGPHDPTPAAPPSLDAPTRSSGPPQAAPVPMDLGTLDAHIAGPAPCLQPAEPLTADFFRTLLGENTRNIISRIDNIEDLGNLTKTVDHNKPELEATRAELKRPAGIIAEQRSPLIGLGDRINNLEQGDRAPKPSSAALATRSADFLRTRRAIRLWPIDSKSEDVLWQAVGNFIQETLEVPDSDVCPEDIESITPLPDLKFKLGNLSNEVLVTFFDAKKRDMIVSNAQNLAGLVDTAGAWRSPRNSMIHSSSSPGLAPA